MDRAVFGRLGRGIREFFLLGQARRESIKLAASQRRAVQTYYDGAKRRIAVARGLRELSQSNAALSLYRGAAVSLTLAFLVSKEETVDVASLSPDAAFDELVATLRRDGLEAPPAFQLARRMVIGPEPAAVERLSPPEAACAIGDFDGVTDWLLALVEPRSPQRLMVTSVARMLLSLLAVGAIAAWIANQAALSRNMAWRKPARASSVDVDSLPAGAVDGIKDGRFGFHTRSEDSPWWSVDLGRPRRIETIKVFGRGDCCFDQSIPLVLEASDHEVSYHTITERREPFSERDPWIVSPDSLVARFVRLRKEGHGLVVLGEVEIYGQ